MQTRSRCSPLVTLRFPRRRVRCGVRHFDALLHPYGDRPHLLRRAAVSVLATGVNTNISANRTAGRAYHQANLKCSSLRNTSAKINRVL